MPGFSFVIGFLVIAIVLGFAVALASSATHDSSVTDPTITPTGPDNLEDKAREKKGYEFTNFPLPEEEEEEESPVTLDDVDPDPDDLDVDPNNVVDTGRAPDFTENAEYTLQEVPGVGEKLEQRIVGTLGIYKSEELEQAARNGDLKQVPGFSTKRIDSILNYFEQPDN
jgi:hypothetical protein